MLLFRQSVQPHQNYLQSGIYYFLDRDFDDLKGFAPGPEVFLTEMYSVENYLVSERVLESILTDEFKCAGEKIESALSLFRTIMKSFCEAMLPGNRRIFYARRLSIGLTGSGIENGVTKYVATELELVRAIASSEDLGVLIPLKREPDTEETRKIDFEFDELDPPSRHRGKFILAFFLKWLDLLAEERTFVRKGIFSSPRRVHFSAQQLSMRSLATRSEVPSGLKEFLRQVSASPLSAG